MPTGLPPRPSGASGSRIPHAPRTDSSWPTFAGPVRLQPFWTWLNRPLGTSLKSRGTLKLSTARLMTSCLRFRADMASPHSVGKEGRVGTSGTSPWNERPRPLRLVRQLVACPGAESPLSLARRLLKARWLRMPCANCCCALRHGLEEARPRAKRESGWRA